MNLESLTLEEKVGQLFMVGFHGQKPNGDIINLITKYHVGGICYFSRNLKNPKQVHRLSTELQSFTNINTPLFLSIDQEGGMVSRMTEGVTVSPSKMALGAIDNRLYTKQIAQIVARELKGMGINMNFDPSVDVNTNPKNPVIGVRSFGENVKKVSKHGLETINGYQKENVSAVVKHFPGHGDTEVDSHLNLPIIAHSLERIHSVELSPFKYAIENGVDAVMVSHVSFPNLEKELPATLSPNIVQGLLRKELGFEGVIVSDCMEMLAIENQYSSEESAILAIKAGVDLILFSHTYEKQRKAIDAVIQAVKDGVVSEKRIDESVTRILALKHKRKMGQFNEYNRESFNRRRNIEFAQKLSEQSITIVKNEHELLPLDQNKQTVLIWPTITKTSQVAETFKQTKTLGHFLQEKLNNFTELPLSTDEAVLNACKDSEQIIIATYNLTQDKENLHITKEIVNQFHQKTVICAFGNPYDFLEVPDVSAYVSAYDIRPITQHSVAKTLCGLRDTKAKLPVKLPSITV